MRKTFHEPPPEVNQMFNQEWKRAKKIYRPLLDDTKRPRFYVTNKHCRRVNGYCRGTKNTWKQRINGRWIKTQFVIWLTKKGLERGFEEVRQTIRHEITHSALPNHNHDSRFQKTLELLNEKQSSPENCITN